ncbi:MAG: hypothetical protein ABR498_05100 [Candidatus Dormibacteria bacterium]
MTRESCEYQHDYIEPVPPPPPPPGYLPVTAPVQRAYTTNTVAAPRGFRGRQLVWVCLAIVDLILALDFLFLLAGANNVGFARAIYAIGAALAAPFRGIFAISTTPGHHPVVWTDLLAIVIYSIAAWIVDRLIVIVSTPSSRRGVRTPPY